MKILGAFRKDLLRKELLSVKILMFLIYGGQATLYPYFTVHLKSLNVSIEMTSIIFAVQPAVVLLVAPMVGLWADRIGNFKFLFCCFLIFSAVTSNLLLLVPAVKEPQISFSAYCCPKSGKLVMSTENSRCKQLQTSNNNTYINLKINFVRHTVSSVIGNGSSILICAVKDSKCTDICKDEGNADCTVVENHSAKLVTSVVVNEDRTLDVQNVTYRGKLYSSLACQCIQPHCNTSYTITSEALPKTCYVDNTNFAFGKTFWMYLSIRLVVTLGIGLVNGLFDAASMAIVQKARADVGFQRFWSTVGMCIFAPLSGFLVDSSGGNFKPCFFMYAALYAMAAITSLFLDLSMKIPSENSFQSLFQLLKNPEVFLMLVHVAALGICWGFLENFLFWFLEEELHSTNLLMGLTVTVGSGTGLFMALVSTWCTRKVGYVNVMVIAFAAYSVRFVGYSFAQDPYVCLVFEMMENFTVTLLTVGVTMYCAEIASLEMLTTMMTLWNGLHVISGRAFGSLLGGFLMSRIGARKTFLVFAYACVGFGTFYAVMNFCWLRKRIKTRRETISDRVSRKRSSLSEDSEAGLNQALTSSTMHCSFDSPALIAYPVDSQAVLMRRRALSHIPATSNSFRRVQIQPRLIQSFSAPPGEPLPTIFEMQSDIANCSEARPQPGDDKECETRF